jgi:hypothetical protein
LASRFDSVNKDGIKKTISASIGNGNLNFSGEKVGIGVIYSYKRITGLVMPEEKTNVRHSTNE